MNTTGEMEQFLYTTNEPLKCTLLNQESKARAIFPTVFFHEQMHRLYCVGSLVVLENLACLTVI